MTAQIYWLVTSPRLPAGILTAQAWDVLRAATHIYTGADTPQSQAVRAAGITVEVLAAAQAAPRLLADGGVWLVGPDGDEDLARDLAVKLAANPSQAQLELLPGSWDPPGARLLDAVAVIDQLRSPNGCPWDAAQTHESLAPFLLEETYETIDAIQSQDSVNLREELGDLLMQPILHARLAAEPEDGFTIDDVAGDMVAKLIRRHPHVFGDEQVEHVDELHGKWDALKRAEKPERRYATDGVASAQPALSLAAKYLSRTARAGLDVPLPEVSEGNHAAASSPDGLGEALLSLVATARAAGIDPELALRQAAARFAQRARDIEDANR